MTTMLEQAVVDATALKEAAVKNAETVILEKYAEEIKEVVDSVLEQDEEGLTLDVGDEAEGTGEVDPVAQDLPLAATEGDDVCPCPEEDEEVEINFDELAQAMDDEEEDMDALGEQPLGEDEGQTVEIPAHLASDLHMYHYGMGDPIYKVGSLAHAGKPVPVELVEDAIDNLESFLGKVDPEDKEDLSTLIGELTSVLTDADEPYGMDLGMDESDLDGLTEEVIDSMLESLEVDYQNVPNGWDVGATEAAKKEAAEAALAAAQDDRVKEETEELNKAFDKIAVLKESLQKSQEDNKKLAEQNKSLIAAYNSVKSIAKQAGEKLSEMNVKNAKLFYKNRILESDSLNEQQKKRLVEAVSKVDSVEKAKIAYETLQESLNESKTRSNKDETINEVVGRSRGSVLNLGNQQRKAEDPWKLRNQVLAGIKK